MSSTAAHRVLRVGGLLVLLAVAWWLAAPPALGGQSALVSVVGRSMEPSLHAGDLVLLRGSDDYAVGDTVGYRSETVGRVVLHRVVDETDGRLTLQGDNNSWVDPDHPTPEELVGRQVVRVPRGGVVLRQGVGPVGLGVLACGLILSGGRVGRRRRRKGAASGVRASRGEGGRRRRPPPDSPSRGGRTAVAALVGTAVLAAFAAAGLLLVASDGTTGGSTDPRDPRSLRFSYRADVLPSAAYDGTTVSSPRPVFRAVARSVEVDYRYAGPAGTLGVTAELSTPGGWRSQVPLRGDEEVGSTYAGRVTLDLDRLERRARRAAEVTGLAANEVAVTVAVDVTTAAGDGFTGTLPLTLSAQRLALVADPEGRGSGTVVVEQKAPTVEVDTDAVTVLGIASDRGSVRLAAAVLAGIALVSALWLSLLLRRRLAAGDEGLIRRRYSSLLIEVEPVSPPAGRPVVEVGSFATLARLAERYGLLVMHWSRSGVQTYTVQDDAATYRYRTGGEAVPAATGPLEPSGTAGPQHG